MIRHITLFKLAPANTETVVEARKVLDNSTGKIPQFCHFAGGVHIFDSNRAYDLALVAKFGSIKD